MTASHSFRTTSPAAAAALEDLEPRQFLSHSHHHAAAPATVKPAVHRAKRHHPAAATSKAPAKATLTTASQIPASEPVGANGALDATWTNLARFPLFAGGGPTATDVIQGSLSDCFLMATLATVAQDDPSVITNLVHQNADGSYDVVFHPNGGTVDEHVDGWVPALAPTYPTYARLGNANATWPAIVEKAAAQYEADGGRPSYLTLESGYVTDALALLGITSVAEFDSPMIPYTDKPHVTSASDLFNLIQSALAQGQAVEYETAGSVAGSLTPAHVFSVLSANVDARGNETVALRNPWATTGPRGDGVETVTAQALFAQFFRADVATV